MSKETNLVKVAQAEDTYDLLNHIAWTDVIKPRLLERREAYNKMLVSTILGYPLPEGLTKEMIAGKVYGINEIVQLMEQILTQGEKALSEIQSTGISL